MDVKCQTIHDFLVALHQVMEYLDAGLQLNPDVQKMALIHLIDALERNDHVHAGCMLGNPVLTLGLRDFKLLVSGFDRQNDIIQLAIGLFRIVWRCNQLGKTSMLAREVIHGDPQILKHSLTVGNNGRCVQEIPVALIRLGFQ